MAIPISHLTLNKAIELLDDNKVISRFRDYSTKDADTGCVVQKRIVNCFQFAKENGAYMFYGFDSFGAKLSKETKEISTNEMEVYINDHHAYRHDRSDKQWSYHTKKVSKKELNANVNNEADIKYLVYEWLLSLDKDLVVVPEFSVGERRADYMAFSKTETYLVEIKSEVDTLERLEEQLKAYQNIGNYIYVAFHESKALKMQNIALPDSIGLFVVSNNTLKLIKKPKKNKIDKMIFESYVSYSEYAECVYGLKYSSKFTKEQIIQFINTTFTQKQRADFYYETIRIRNELESNKRKACWEAGDFKSALGKASLVGVNRMAPKGCTVSTLVHFFKVPQDILFKYYTSMEDAFNKRYLCVENIKMLFQDPAFVRYLFDEHGIHLFANNELSLFEKALAAHGKITKIWEALQNHYDSCIQAPIGDLSKNEKKLLILTVFSAWTKKMVLEHLNNIGIDKTMVLMEKTDSYYPDYKRMHKKCLESGLKVVVVHSTRGGFGIKDQETEEFAHRVIDFKPKNIE